jgi:hypothetical protein
MAFSMRILNGLKFGFEIIDASILQEIEEYEGAKLALSIEFLCFGLLFVKL